MAKWDEMSPRERDALVAEKVMGWQPYMLANDEVMDGYFYTGLTTWPTAPSAFTTDIAAAWEVMERMRKNGCLVSVHNVMGGYRSTIVPHEHDAFWGDAPTAPEAICLAALRAKGVDV